MWLRIVVSIVFSFILAFRGYKKKSLDLSGAISGFLVGLLTTLAGYRYCLVLATFFLSSSALTKYQHNKKSKIEEDFKEGGQRNWVQVFANGATGTVCCVLQLLYFGMDDTYLSKDNYWATFLKLCFLVHYAVCNGDTWASELGVLSQGKPILVTTLQTVPTGTNGGISLLGTGASIAGGLLIGFTFWICGIIFAIPNHVPQYSLIFVGLLSGLLGSLVDSLMGATLQVFYFHSKKCIQSIIHFVVFWVVS